MLTLKWKLYRVFNYALLIIALLLAAVVIVDILKYQLDNSTEPVFYLMALLFLLMFINPIINIVLFIKHLPDKVLEKGSALSNNVSIFINTLTVIGLAVFLIYGAMEVFDPDQKPAGSTGKIILLLFFLLWLINLFVLICQLQFKRFLSKNRETSMTSLIESIGNKS